MKGYGRFKPTMNDRITRADLIELAGCSNKEQIRRAILSGYMEPERDEKGTYIYTMADVSRVKNYLLTVKTRVRNAKKFS